jgi:hypothetical protein
MIVPLFVFSGGESAPVLVPAWLNVFGVIAIGLWLLGAIGLTITILLDVAFDRECEGLFKVSFATFLISLMLLIIIVFMALILGK